MFTDPTTPEEILNQAIEIKQAMDSFTVPVKVKCGWYGDKFVHFDWCDCDSEEDRLMDSRL